MTHSTRASRRTVLIAATAAVAGVAGAGASTANELARTDQTLLGAGGDSIRGKNDHVLYWNVVILDIFRQRGGAPGPLARGGAMMNIAIYDSVNSIRRIGKPYKTYDSSATGAIGALNTAIDYAAYTALRNAFPTYPVAELDAKFKVARAMPDSGSTQDRDRGKRLGLRTANAIIFDRANDGSGDTTPYAPTDAAGHWLPATGVPVGAPNWGKVKPFALSSGSQFRPGNIGGFATPRELLESRQYAAQVNEIKRIGSKNSTVRTADQTQLAHFWANDLDGTYKPVGQQYAHTDAVFRKYRPYGTSFESARLFALTSISLADGAIAIWDSKFNTEWDVWRPVDAIRKADLVPNPDLTQDAIWEPLESDLTGKSFSPNFPTYVSGHSGVASSWAGVLQKYFGTDDLPFTGGTDDPFARGVTRSFPSLSAAASEKAASRKYIGVHFEWDNAAALRLGYQVADTVYTRL